MVDNPPLSLYIHIPFCEKKCPYCSFCTLPNKGSYRSVFLASVLREYTQKLPLLSRFTVRSIYFGGGTPSLFPEAIEKLLERCSQDLTLAPVCEITAEANPEDLDRARLKRLYQAGINRLSIGVQTLTEAVLSCIGRHPCRRQIIESIWMAHEVGFENISIDLIYDLPLETWESFSRGLDEIESFPLDHLSLYNLVFERGTPFYRERKRLHTLQPAEKDSLHILEQTVARLESMGLIRYEISAFARVQKEAIHNSGYWKGGPFIGLGPSACSFFEGRRFQNEPQLARYAQLVDQACSPISFEERLPPCARAREALVVGLRLVEGVDLGSLTLDAGTLGEIDRLCAERLLEQEPASTIRLTERGRLFYDQVASALV